MNRTAGRLADGREIIFFDRHDTTRTISDKRDLAAVATSSQMRHDVLTDEWVAITAHRQTRTFLPPKEFCPLCPSRGDFPTEIPEPDYDVVVFENRFPSFAIADATGTPAESGVDTMARQRPAAGRCEVVCFTSEHAGSFASLTHEQAALVVDAWADRTAELSALPQVQQVFPFENRGQEIGVTLHHPHGQIYGYPFVTPKTRQMLRTAHAYAEQTGRNLFADAFAAELNDGTRVLLSSEHWVAFVPFAARWPVEIHLYPRRQVPDLAALDADERTDLAQSYLTLLRAVDQLFGVPLPYLAGWYQAPTLSDRDLVWLHLRLVSIRRAPDKLKYLASSESGMGAFINDIPPERMAEKLRSLLGPTPPPGTVE